MKDTDFDVVIIGAGPGGYVCAIRCGQLGLKVALVEKRSTFGGTCLNVGCIPSKYLLQASEHYAKLKNHGSYFGLKHKGLSFDIDEMQTQKEKIIGGLSSGIAGLLKKNKVSVFEGTGELLSPFRVRVKGKNANELNTKHVVLAMGSEPIALPFLPFDEKSVLSSTGALALRKVPQTMTVVGAGVIGLELASVYCRLGTKVTVVEFTDRLCGAMDRSVTQALQKILTAEGFTFILNAAVTKGKVDADCVALMIQKDKETSKLSSDVVLVAIGRRPLSGDVGLDALGIQRDPKGFIFVDKDFRTAASNIFAIGDLIDGPMLAHKAEEEGVAVAEILAGKDTHIDYLTIPGIVYTWPEIGSVGLTEEEAKAKGLDICVGTFSFKAIGRAICAGDTEGFVKIIAEKNTDKIVGVHILGPNASELIAEGVTAMKNKMTATDLSHMCHGHPTLSEAIKEAALAVHKRAIHS